MKISTGNSWRRIRELVRERDGEACQYCGKTALAGEADHILPLSKGGSDTLDNLVWACSECNAQKKDMTLREWVKQCLGFQESNMPRLPYRNHVGFSAAGWECDCGGWAYRDEPIPADAAHHHPDCPILTFYGWGIISPMFSKITNGKPSLYASTINLTDQIGPDEVLGIDYRYDFNGKIVRPVECTQDVYRDFEEHLTQHGFVVDSKCGFCGRFFPSWRDSCYFCGGSLRQ